MLLGKELVHFTFFTKWGKGVRGDRMMLFI